MALRIAFAQVIANRSGEIGPQHDPGTGREYVERSTDLTLVKQDAGVRDRHRSRGEVEPGIR